MRNYKIKKGSHYDSVILSTGIWISRKPTIKRLVSFAANCRYTLPAYNSQDVNKLFGLSFGFGGVHHNSARFGWRYSASQDCIELLAYCYSQGARNWNDRLEFPVVATVKLGETIELGIEYDATEGAFTFYAYTPTGGFIGCESVKATTNLPCYGLTHSLYFGGTLPAPNDLEVMMSKKKENNVFKIKDIMINKLKFPAGIIVLIAFAVTLIDYYTSGGFSKITYYVNYTALALFAAFVLVALVNSLAKK